MVQKWKFGKKITNDNQIRVEARQWLLYLKHGEPILKPHQYVSRRNMFAAYSDATLRTAASFVCHTNFPVAWWIKDLSLFNGLNILAMESIGELMTIVAFGERCLRLGITGHKLLVLWGDNSPLQFQLFRGYAGTQGGELLMEAFRRVQKLYKVRVEPRWISTKLNIPADTTVTLPLGSYMFIF